MMRRAVNHLLVAVASLASTESPGKARGRPVSRRRSRVGWKVRGVSFETSILATYERGEGLTSAGRLASSLFFSSFSQGIGRSIALPTRSGIPLSHLAVLERQHDLIGPAREAGESLRKRTLALDPVAVLVDQRQVHGSLLSLQCSVWPKPRLSPQPRCQTCLTAPNICLTAPMWASGAPRR